MFATRCARPAERPRGAGRVTVAGARVTGEDPGARSGGRRSVRPPPGWCVTAARGPRPSDPRPGVPSRPPVGPPNSEASWGAKGCSPSHSSLIRRNGACKCAFRVDSPHRPRAHHVTFKYKGASVLSKTPEAPSWSPSSEMAPGGKKLCFVFIFFLILAQFPSGKREWGRGERF